MAVISLMLFSVCCTLLALFGVILFDVPVMLILRIYLGYCATLVLLALILSRFLPKAPESSGAGEREKDALLTKRIQSEQNANNTKVSTASSAGYKKLVKDYRRLGPLQATKAKSER